MKKAVQNQLGDCLERHPSLQVCRESVICAFDILVKCHKEGGLLLVCGNGGSASDAEHITGELMNRFLMSRPLPEPVRQKLGIDKTGLYLGQKLNRAFRAVSLVSQTSLITAIANDLGPDLVFAQQVYGYGKPGDVLFALSTSGNSDNIINALRVAKALDIKTIGFTGGSGGNMAMLCDCLVKAPSALTPIIQEYHVILYHLICSMIETEIF
ncbi:MAG: SIS domain-containing protein [Chitinispirillales bacterium]|jgi:D-sedoheptulose 7-phosphate isomerase|nr:SIS domain-containing protein [Chitinispirillales bacterium]